MCVSLLFMFLLTQLATSIRGGVTLYVSACKVTEGNGLRCIVEVWNVDKKPRTLFLPVGFERRQEVPNAFVEGKQTNPAPKNNGGSEGRWFVYVECWAPFPARHVVLSPRGPFEIKSLVVPARGVVTLRVVVPAVAFEAGHCKIRAVLFENGHGIASSSMITVECR
jgi:hypothetical protein